MKKKIITVFLSCFLVAQSYISSFAFVPALVVAPEVASLIATVLVGGGMAFNNLKDLSKGVEYFTNHEGFIDKVLPSLTSSVNKFKDGVVEVGSDVFDYMESLFINKGTNLCINGLSVNSFSFKDFYDIQKNDHLMKDLGLMKGSIYTIPLTPGTHTVRINDHLHFDISCDESYLFEGVAVLKYDNEVVNKYTFSRLGGIQETKVSFVYTYMTGNVTSNEIKLYNYSGLYGNNDCRWRVSVGSKVDIYDFLSKKGQIDSFNNVGKVFNPDNLKEHNVCVSPPSNVKDLLQGSNYNVFNPSASSWKAGEVISFPSNGVLDIGKSIGVGSDVVSSDKVATDTNTATTTDTATTDTTKTTDWSNVFPPWGEGINFKPVTQINFTDKFPFCLASDVKGLINIFNVEPKAPIFEVPIFTEKLKIDLSQFTTWANIIKFFVLIGFVLCLINITRKVIG